MERHEVYHSAYREIDTRPAYEIAASKYHLHGISKPGLFDWIVESRHYIGPLDALIDDRTREVNVLKPVRGGGSVIGDLFLLWALDNDPGNYMQVLQTDDEVSNYVTNRSIKNLEKSLPDLLPRVYPKGEGEMELKNGAFVYFSGPGISNMQTKMIRYMHLDEPWMYKKGILNEAKARLGDCKRLHISKLLCISQGGPQPGKALEDSDWFHHAKEGEANEWEALCPECGKKYQPIFSGQREDRTYWGVTFETYKHQNGDYDVRKCVETAHFRCQHCNCVTVDGPRIKSHWNRTGDYAVIGDRYSEKRTFHWEAVIMDNWRDLVDLWLTACNHASRGNYLPKLQFYQKYRAIQMDEMTLLRREMKIGRLVINTSEVWEEEVVRFLTVDKQSEDFYWYLVCAWSKDGKVRRLAFGSAYGVAELDQIREKFKVHTFLTTQGKGSFVFIDSAHDPKGSNGVYAACCKYGWIAAKGASPEEGVFIHDVGKGRRVGRSYSAPTEGDPDAGQRHEGMRRAIVVRFVKPTMNSRVQGLIDNNRIEHASDLGESLEEEYRAQMASRIKKTDYDPKTGRKKTFWWEGKNDHVRDCWNMQALGATLKNILPDTLDGMEAKTEAS